MRLFERITFVILLITFPIQLGKHFWPEFSFVQGIRVDYLSPTLYLSDIAILILFAISFIRLKSKIWAFLTKRIVICLVAVVLVGAISAISSHSAIYGILKLLEFLWLGFYIASTVNLNYKKDLVFVFVLGGLVQTAVLIFQFISQRSLGGLFYFLGERTFDPSTPGIALFRLSDELILRPYGTFPHPNLLACYLFVVFIFILFYISHKTFARRLIKSLLLFIIGFGIMLTFSRVIAVLLFICWFMYFKNNKYVLLVLGILVCLIVTMFFGRFENEIGRDVFLRIDLLKIALKIFAEKPLLGVGLNNFYYHEILYQKTITPILLQPVHNIYFYWLAAVGFLGTVPLAIFIYKTALRIKSKLNFVLFGSLLVIGFFDHYLVTLQQGQLMLSFVIGFIYSGMNSKTKE